MQTDKSTAIQEAQWIEKEIPRLEAELQTLKTQEQDLLTAPLETVAKAYTRAYRAERKRMFRLYHRRRTVTPTRYGYRERMLDVGWIPVLIRVVIAALAILAVYVAYHNHQIDHTNRGIVWGSVLLVLAIVLAVAPPLIDHFLERRARQKAELAAQQARQSIAFRQEKQNRQTKLRACQERIAESEERLQFARVRFDQLRKTLTSENHQGGAAQ